MPRTGRPPAIAAEQYPVLVKLAHAHPFSSQAELADAFHAETGITAHPDTFAKALKLAGITRIKQRAKGSFVSPNLVSRMATTKRTDASCRSNGIPVA